MVALTGLAIGSGMQVEGVSWFSLESGMSMPAWMGVDYELCSSTGHSVDEEIRIRMRGSEQDRHLLLRQIEHALRGTHAENALSAYLRLHSGALQAFVYAHILKADFEIIGGHLSSQTLGSCSIVIKIVRENQFVGDEKRLEIYNSGGTGDAQGLTLFNHDDAQIGHDNWFGVHTSALNATRPYPLRLEFYVPDGAVTVADMHLGTLLMTVPNSPPAMNLEAENGSGGVSVSDIKASNGKFQRYSWTGNNWVPLGNWALSWSLMSKLSGHLLMPILRLHNAQSQSGVRLRWVLKQQGKRIYEGPACVVQAGQSGQVFTPLDLGTSQLPLLSFVAGFSLVLEGMQSEGTTTLDVDDILLLPLKQYRFYQSLSGLSPESTLIDDKWRGMCWTVRDDQELKTHLNLGDGHVLFPGTEQRFYVFMSDTAQKSPIDIKVKVRAWYRPVMVIP